MAGTGDAFEGARPLKRRRIDQSSHHVLRHRQAIPTTIEPAPQDAFFVQGQLVRAISSALSAVGFDSVKPSALEALHAETEEYMLHFLAIVRESMSGSRRTQPLPQDFSLALAFSNLNPSDLKAHLDLELPDLISSPEIPLPPPDEATPAIIAPMLGGELAITNENTHPYIPSHFPQLPSRHAWRSTPVFTEREKDARKIRERATQEGILAEQALRKLMSANQGRSRTERSATRADRNREQLWKDTLADVLGDEGIGMSQSSDVDGDVMLAAAAEPKLAGGVAKVSEPLGNEAGIAVNYDQGHWRRGGPRGAVRT